jgi:hypothetical protein
VFWVNGGTVKANDATPGAALANDEVVNATTGAVTAFAAGPDAFYLGEAGESAADLGLVERTRPVVSPAPVTLARAQPSPSSLAVGATRAF